MSGWFLRVSAVSAVLALVGPPGGSGRGDEPVGPPKPVATAGAGDDLAEILARWERQTAAVRTVEAWFSLVRRFPDWDDEVRLDGWAKFATPDRACVQLSLTVPAAGEAAAGTRRFPAERVVCTGEKVYQYVHAARQVYIFSQETDGQASSWGEALRFLRNVRADDLRQRYRLALVKVTPKTYLIQAFTRDGVSGSHFTRADLILDRVTFTPSVLRLVALNGKDTETFRFRKVVRDGPINPSFFKGGVLPGWTVVNFTGPVDPTAKPDRPLPPPIESRPAPAPGPR